MAWCAKALQVVAAVVVVIVGAAVNDVIHLIGWGHIAHQAAVGTQRFLCQHLLTQTTPCGAIEW
jgi:hypothetical protein